MDNMDNTHQHSTPPSLLSPTQASISSTATYDCSLRTYNYVYDCLVLKFRWYFDSVCLAGPNLPKKTLKPRTYFGDGKAYGVQYSWKSRFTVLWRSKIFKSDTKHATNVLCELDCRLCTSTAFRQVARVCGCVKERQLVTWNSFHKH